MPHRSPSRHAPARRFLPACAALALGALAASCGADPPPQAPPPAPAGPQCAAPLNTSPEGEPWAPAPDPAEPLAASFQVTIDPAHPALQTDQREPLAAPVTVTALGGTLRLEARVKTFVKHPARLHVELYLVNDEDVGWRDVTATVEGITGSQSFYDFNDDPWAAPTAERTLLVGGIAPEGVGRAALGFDAAADLSPITFTLGVAGTTTRRTSTASAPIAITPDGAEVWAVQGDGDVVAVIDTATDQRVAQVKIPGRPSSVAVTPDGALVLVTASACNQLTVIDRASREVRQVLGEAEGIGRDPRNLLVTPDGGRALVSAYVGDSVTALERVGDAFRVSREIPVGRRPTGLGATPDGRTVFVAHFLPRGKIQENGAWISVLDAERAEEVGEVEIRDDGNVEAAACIRAIPGFDQYTAEELSFESTPSQLYGVFLEPGGASAWSPGMRLLGFPVFEGDAGNIGFEFLVIGANSPPNVFSIDTRAPRAARPRRPGGLIDYSDRGEDFLRCLPVFESAEIVTDQPFGDDPDLVQNPGASVPTVATPLSETGMIRFVGYTRGGRRSLMLSHAADEIVVEDTATRSPTTRFHFELGGSNPTGIVVTPDGAKGYVSYEGSLFVSVLDLSAYAEPLPEPEIVPYRFDYGAPGQGGGIITFGSIVRSLQGVPERPPIVEVGQVAILDEDPMDPVLRRGKILFSSSNPDKYPTLSGNREATCNACHPDGGNDGSAWATVEGERRTIGLWGGTAGRGWLHWSATHRDPVDFATTIVRERLGGQGLSEEDERALAEYVARGIPEVQRPRVDEALAARGASVFEARCRSCHQGEAYGSGDPDPASPFGGGGDAGPLLYDLGTATDWAEVGLGVPYSNLFPPTPKKALSLMRGDRALGAGDELQPMLQYEPRPDRARGSFKAPSLVNVWENATFFHDARTDSLEEAVQDVATRTGGPLAPEDLAAVVEFLKTL